LQNRGKMLRSIESEKGVGDLWGKTERIFKKRVTKECERGLKSCVYEKRTRLGNLGGGGGWVISVNIPYVIPIFRTPLKQGEKGKNFQ